MKDTPQHTRTHWPHSDTAPHTLWKCSGSRVSLWHWPSTQGGWSSVTTCGTYGLCVAVEGSQVQGCAAILVHLVYLGSFLNQKLDHCPVTLQTSPAKCWQTLFVQRRKSGTWKKSPNHRTWTLQDRAQEQSISHLQTPGLTMWQAGAAKSEADLGTWPSWLKPIGVCGLHYLLSALVSEKISTTQRLKIWIGKHWMNLPKLFSLSIQRNLCRGRQCCYLLKGEIPQCSSALHKQPPWGASGPACHLDSHRSRDPAAVSQSETNTQNYNLSAISL